MSLHGELCDVLYLTVKNSVKDVDRVVIAFSGGVDSTLLAKICIDLKKQVHLVTLGFPNSHDLLFSRAISVLLPNFQSHVVYEMCERDFDESIKHVKSKITCNSLSHIENCIAFLYVSKIIKERHLGTFFLTANGLDELFCGYDKFRFYVDKGCDAVLKFMEEKLINEFHLMGEISQVIGGNGIKSFQPFLTSDFIDYAKKIPLEYKIKGNDDSLRKHIIRQIALDIGVPKESALYPKKALQYGTLIHKHIIKKKSILL